MPPLLVLEQIHKAFEGTAALKGASLQIQPGEVHALLGENGAGKSTLMKIAAGILRPDRGSLFWKGHPVSFSHPVEALQTGIFMIHQELSLVPQLSVAENLFLGRWPAARRGWLRPRELRRRCRPLLERVGLDCPPDIPVSSLSLAEWQRVEIARALAQESHLIVMDEPTSSLSGPEVERLFQIVQELVARQVAVVYISHRLEEVERLAHRLTILRDGKEVAAVSRGELSREEWVRLMAGRELRTAPGRKPRRVRQELLQAEGVCVPPRVRDIHFTLRAGEVVGLAGLVGSGRTDLLHGLFGVLPLSAGTLRIQGNPVQISTPRAAVRLGMGLVTEDRRRSGLVPTAGVGMNTVLAFPQRYSRWGFFDAEREQSAVRQLAARLSLRTPDLEAPVRRLSGGNQQKVILARWLYARVQIFLLDEPTRGIDVASRLEVYRLIEELAHQGVGILLVSSELGELLSLADRILVMRSGRLVGELEASRASEEKVLALALGGEG